MLVGMTFSIFTRKGRIFLIIFALKFKAFLNLAYLSLRQFCPSKFYSLGTRIFKLIEALYSDFFDCVRMRGFIVTKFSISA